MTELKSYRKNPDCLSGIDISCIAVGEAADHPDPTGHLATCETCKHRLSLEEGQVDQHRRQALPGWLSEAPASSGWLSWRGWGAGFAVAMAAALVVVLPRLDPEPDGFVPKRAPSVSVTVIREDRALVRDLSVADLPALREGDRVGLSLGMPGYWVVVSSQDPSETPKNRPVDPEGRMEGWIQVPAVGTSVGIALCRDLDGRPGNDCVRMSLKADQ